MTTYITHRDEALTFLRHARPTNTAEHLAAAQVNATLALAAATHDVTLREYTESIDLVPVEPQGGAGQPLADWERELYVAPREVALAEAARDLALASPNLTPDAALDLIKKASRFVAGQGAVFDPTVRGTAIAGFMPWQLRALAAVMSASPEELRRWLNPILGRGKHPGLIAAIAAADEED